MKIEQKLKTKILSAAISIGDDILLKANKEKVGVSWKTLSQDGNQNSTWNTSEGIYAGVSGIVVFLIELHRTTNDKKYLTAAIEGMSWVEDYCKHNVTDYYSFVTGRMGAAYAMSKLAKATGNEEYLKRSLEIAKNCDNYLKTERIIDEYINGSAGILMCLIHLHAETNEPWLLEKINAYTERILNNCFNGPKGIYWDRSDKNIHGLCGFSHGAAGIGFVLLELGNYFQNPAFYFMAEQVFIYESFHFNKEQQNWPDYRKGIFSAEDLEKNKKAYLDNNVDFFTKPGFMSNWCHGANGLGLSRIRAYELLKDESYKKDFEVAVNKTIGYTVKAPSEYQSQCYCHGESGDAEIFLEGYRVLKNEKYLDQALLVAEKMITNKEKTGCYNHGYAMLRQKEQTEDISLYMGNSGIGYFYLKLLNPLNTDSMLATSVRKSIADKKVLQQYPSLAISISDIKINIIRKSYKRTYDIAEQLISDKMEQHLSKSHKGAFLEEFEYFINDAIFSLSGKNKNLLVDVFELERLKKKMDDHIVSDAYLYVKTIVEMENAKKLCDLQSSEFSELQLQWTEDICIHQTKWNWNESNFLEKNLKNEGSEYALLLKPSYMGIIELPLNEFLYAILDTFKESKKVAYACEVILSAFEEIPADQVEEVKQKIVAQIKETLLMGILRTKA